MNYFSINKFSGINSCRIFNVCLVLLIAFFTIGCNTHPGKDITSEELKIVNWVIDDVFENFPYELDCQIHPVMQKADKYGGDFTTLLQEGISVFNDGAQVLANMNKADAIWIPNTDGIGDFHFINPVIRTKMDTIPLIADRSKAILKMSTLGCNDAGNECVIIADRIFSNLNQTRHIYFLKKDANGDFTPLDKKVSRAF